MGSPTNQELAEALSKAGSAHHEYETIALKGARDEQWAGWYAAFVIGRHGDFAKPSDLTKWLQEAEGGDDWSASAAAHVLKMLGTG